MHRRMNDHSRLLPADCNPLAIEEDWDVRVHSYNDLPSVVPLNNDFPLLCLCDIDPGANVMLRSEGSDYERLVPHSS